MKNMLRNITSACSLFLCFILLESNMVAQCVRCAPSGNRFVCVASASGGKQCVTEGDDFCAIRTPCGRAGGIDELGFRIAPQTINEVATVHPRFAAALVFLNRNNMIGQEVTLHMSAKKISSTDVEGLLTSEPSKRTMQEVLQDLKAEIADKEVVKQDRPPYIIYRLIKADSTDKTRSVIKLQVVRGKADDPPYSVLELDVTNAQDVNAERKELHVTNWRVR